MRNETKLPAIGKVGTTFDAETYKTVSALKEVQEVREGRRGSDYLDKHVSYRDLVNLGLITEDQVPRKP